MEKSIKRYWPVFILPTMAAFMIGFVVPFLEGIYLSFCDFTTIKDASFVGLENYAKLFLIRHLHMPSLSQLFLQLLL